MSDDLLERARFVVQLFQECDAIQLPHGPTEQVLIGMIDRIETLEARIEELTELCALEYQRAWLLETQKNIAEENLAKAVKALRGWIDFANAEGMPVLLSDLEAAELTGDKE